MYPRVTRWGGGAWSRPGTWPVTKPTASPSSLYCPGPQSPGEWVSGQSSKSGPLGTQPDSGGRDLLLPKNAPLEQWAPDSTSHPAPDTASSPPDSKVAWPWASVAGPAGTAWAHAPGGSHRGENDLQASGREDRISGVSALFWLLIFSLRCEYLCLNLWIELELFLFPRRRELRRRRKVGSVFADYRRSHFMRGWEKLPAFVPQTTESEYTAATQSLQFCKVSSASLI